MRKKLLDENLGTRGRAGEVSRCIKSKVKLTAPKSAGSKNGFRQRETKKSKMGKNPVKNIEAKTQRLQGEGRNKIPQEHAQ